MTEHDIEQFLRLESEVWEALTKGEGEADARLLSDDFLGVYTFGFSDRAGHDGPTVGEYALGEARLMKLSDDMVLLAYRAEFRRPGEEAPESVLISSIWQEREGRWINVFSQDTPSPQGSTPFTLSQIHDIHDRLGTMERFPDYVRALGAIGVRSYDSFLTDGHSEYFAVNGHSVVSAAAHEVLHVNEASNRDKVIEHLHLHQLGKTSYIEMSTGLAASGVERWTVDTKAMTLTYKDKQGGALVTDAIDT